MVRIKSLQHIGILVPDAEEAARWYIGKSGFLKKAEFMASGSRVIFVYSPESRVLCEPVSYTHLDVYKRQVVICDWIWPALA